MNKQILFIQGAGEGAYAADQKIVDNMHSELGDTYEIHYPQMPDEHTPDYGPWREAILKETSHLKDGAVLIGHSLGGSLLLKSLAEESSNKLIGGIFLLATPFWGGDSDWQYEGFALPKDFATRIPRVPVFLYHNNDDAVVSSTHVGMYARKLADATVCQRDVGGHQFEGGMYDVAKDILKL